MVLQNLDNHASLQHGIIDATTGDYHTIAQEKFKYLLSVIKHMDFVWLLQDNSTHYHITCIVIAYLCEHPKVLTHMGIVPFVISIGDFKEATALNEDPHVVETRMQRFSPEFSFNMMWQTQIQMDF